MKPRDLRLSNRALLNQDMINAIRECLGFDPLYDRAPSRSTEQIQSRQGYNDIHNLNGHVHERRANWKDW